MGGSGGGSPRRSPQWGGSDRERDGSPDRVRAASPTLPPKRVRTSANRTATQRPTARALPAQSAGGDEDDATRDVPMNEEDQLVGGDEEGEAEAEAEDSLECEMRQAMEDDDDDDDEGQEEQEEQADDGQADEEDPEAEDGCSKMASTQAAPSKPLMVEYNRKYYHVPGVPERDHGRCLLVETPAKLGAMIATTATAADWPAPQDIDPGAIIVLKGKFREDDARESYGWYVRIVVEGEETSDDGNIARHIPYSVVKEVVSYMIKDVGEGGFANSSLVKEYQPQDSNRRVLVPLPKVNNWEAVAKQPRSLAIKPPGQGGKTKADSAERAAGGAEGREDAPSASTPAPPTKKQATGAATPKKPTLSKTPAAKAPAKAAASAAAKKPATPISKPGAAPAAAATKQTTLQPVRKAPAATPTRPAAKARAPAPAPAPEPEPDPDPPPEEDDDDDDDDVDEDEGADASAPAPEPVWRRPKDNGVPMDLTVDVPQLKKYVRQLDCSEPCEDETLHVRRVYEGVNKPAPNGIFMQKIVLPSTCTDYKVTVEYTVPPSNSDGRRA